MTAITVDAQREKRGIGRVFALPMSNVKIVKGALVCVNTSGYAVSAADTASFVVAGVAIEQVDNSGGSAGDKVIRVDADCEFKFVASSITQAMLGTDMMVVDNNTVDDASGPSNDVPVGKLTEFISTTLGWVYVPGLTK
jgi:hypothetical protein